MSDLVERLRANPNYTHWLCIAEAADRIEALEGVLDRVDYALENILTIDRDRLRHLIAKDLSKEVVTHYRDGTVDAVIAADVDRVALGAQAMRIEELESYLDEEREKNEKQVRMTMELQVEVERLKDIIRRALAVPPNWGNEVYEIEEILKEKDDET